MRRAGCVVGLGPRLGDALEERISGCKRGESREGREEEVGVERAWGSRRDDVEWSRGEAMVDILGGTYGNQGGGEELIGAVEKGSGHKVVTECFVVDQAEPFT